MIFGIHTTVSFISAFVLFIHRFNKTLEKKLEDDEIPLTLLGFTPYLQNLAEVSTFFWLVCWVIFFKVLLKYFENKNKLSAPIFSYPLFFSLQGLGRMHLLLVAYWFLRITLYFTQELCKSYTNFFQGYLSVTSCVHVVRLTNFISFEKKKIQPNKPKSKMFGNC